MEAKKKCIIPLSKMSVKAWPGRTDTLGLVSSLMLSLAMIGMLQFGERLDTLFFGGLFPVSGRVIAFIMVGLGTALFGAVGGFIVAEINPLIATATGTSPIAPFWLITNGIQVIAMLISGAITKDVISWRNTILYAILASLFVVLLYIPLHVLYFKLPWSKLIPMYSFQTAVSIPITAILLRGLLAGVEKTGLISE
jgi:hypothetical protein